MGSRRGTYVIDLRHFMTEDGDLNYDLPTPALNIALHIAQIVAWMTNQPVDSKAEWTNVPCRRNPRRRRCRGDILASFESDPAFGIRWWCPICGDNGFAYGWEDSLWNRGAWVPSSGTAH